MFDAFAPAEVHGKPKERTEWAKQQLRYAAKASANLGLTAHATFCGALIWQTMNPWAAETRRFSRCCLYRISEAMEASVRIV